jgi:N6-L-threonylcarbamoyladenine synthase
MTENSDSPTRILAIETSCDETAAAVVEDGQKILSNVVSSQVELHAKYGGIFPEMASRQHIRVIDTVIWEALSGAHLNLSEVDAIAVTRGPGLPGSLVVGVNAAKGLAMGSNIPLVAVNHLEGHLYSAWLDESFNEDQSPTFPLIALIVSGGHTELVLMHRHLEYERLGGTLDDAAGEAFDKVARLLKLGYPGGPAIQVAAESGDPVAFRFPRAWLPKSWDFSFSGLKTAVLRQVRKLEANDIELPANDLAASFQEAVSEVLVTKTLHAAKQFDAQSILVAGGVSANQAIRKSFKLRASIPVFIPPLSLCTDNAAMIAAAGHRRFLNGQRDTYDFDARPNWPLNEI